MNMDPENGAQEEEIPFRHRYNLTRSYLEVPFYFWEGLRFR